MSSKDVPGGGHTALLGAKQDGPILTLTLERPERKNALVPVLVRDLDRALGRAQNDASVRVVVLTGRGGSFCAGADLEAIRGVPPADIAPRLAEFQKLIFRVTEMDKPVLAAIDGPAVGFGADLALACDLRVLTERAYLQESFTKIGLMPDGGGTHFWPRIAGARAFEIVALGDRLSAADCASLGVANRVVPVSELDAATRELGERLAGLPPLALVAIKRALRAQHEDALRAALAREAEGQTRLLQTADFEEGVAAFLEKRPPRFAGK